MSLLWVGSQRPFLGEFGEQQIPLEGVLPSALQSQCPKDKGQQHGVSPPAVVSPSRTGSWRKDLTSRHSQEVRRTAVFLLAREVKGTEWPFFTVIIILD